MKNKGSVTIFCCLIITAMVLLGITCIKVVSYHMAKAKAAVAVRSAMSGVDAGYNSYIFENYHILLFDKACNGKGEAYLEEQLVADIQHNLGEGFVVEELIVNDYELILEDECHSFKEQIKDYCGYALLESGADAILESTGGKDGTVADYIYEDMEAAGNNAIDFDEEAYQQKPQQELQQEPSENAGDIAAYEDGTNIDLGGWGDTEDPREYTEDLSSEGILALVVPEDMEISSEIVELYGVPSLERLGLKLINYEIDNDFDDMDVLKGDIGEYDSWKSSLLAGGAGLIYVGNVFNCATDRVQENTRFGFEMEYIICGKDSDKANLKGTVNRMLGIRFPVNFSYLVSDVSKMAEISKISWPISLATLVPEPVVKYLIAGCWAYVESIFDVKCLLDGQRMDFFKTKASWKTDLYDLENSTNLEGKESDKGLCYKDYLLILLAMDMESTYYRMLDIIELNTKQHYPEFDMNNGAVGLSVDARISYQGKEYYYSEQIGY